MALISSLMREKRAGNVSSTSGITTEYCGTFSNVGGSDASMLIDFSELAFFHQARNSNLQIILWGLKEPFTPKTGLAIESRSQRDNLSNITYVEIEM